MLLLLASYSTQYKRKLGLPIGGVELVTFGTVVIAVLMGPIWGALFGLLSSIGSELISANLGPLTWIYWLSLAGGGFVVGLFQTLDVFILGMGLTFLILLINQVVYLFIGDAEIKNMTIFYIITNAVFNAAIFKTLAPILINLLS